MFGTEVKMTNLDPKAFDCAELVEWAVHQAGGSIVDGSQNQRRACRTHKTTLSIDKAIKTRGALLFTDSHVAISLGNGKTIEAANKTIGVKQLNANNRGWKEAGLVPGLIYDEESHEEKQEKHSSSTTKPVSINKAPKTTKENRSPATTSSTAQSALLPNFKGADRAGTVSSIQNECLRQGVTMLEQIAYVLATVQHETGDTFQPVKEAPHSSEAYRKAHFRYYPYYGRGYVQLTWRKNYQKYSKLLGLKMVENPEIALRPDVALFVLVHGMKTGHFTGGKLSDYINKAGINFTKARAIINGTDRAALIAGYAKQWLTKLRSARS